MILHKANQHFSQYVVHEIASHMNYIECYYNYIDYYQQDSKYID